VRPDGSVVWLDATCIVLRDAAGAPKFVLALGNDITERRGQEGLLDPQPIATAVATRAISRETDAEREARLEQASDELDSLCRAVAHDVRGPVRIMSGFADILLGELAGTISEDHAYFLHGIRDESRRLGRLLDGLLELSRLTRSSVNRSPIDIEARARAILEELSRCQPERSIEMTVAPGMTADGDPAMVDTLLRHLLGNAIKFTRGVAAPRIEVGCSRSGSGTTYFVRDNGIGFDMAYAHKLFATFERLHGREGFSGDGVGLASVKRIVQRHGGTVWANSTPGNGATFYFTLEA